MSDTIKHNWRVILFTSEHRPASTKMAKEFSSIMDTKYLSFVDFKILDTTAHSGIAATFGINAELVPELILICDKAVVKRIQGFVDMNVLRITIRDKISEREGITLKALRRT